MPNSKLGLLIQLDPKRGKAKLLAQFKRCEGMPTKVAEREGVAHSTVKRWIATLECRDEVNAIRANLGLDEAGPFRAKPEAATA